MREIVMDTETTGLDPAEGHRLVEIAGVEVFNLVPTGSTFHAYINPQRDVPKEAFQVHGLSAEFLADKPVFSDVAADFLEFIADSRLVIHNAEFDMRFINAELGKIGMSAIMMDRVLDTLAVARKKHPGASNSLDALCARYRINNAKRTKHGALLDSELLAEVYAELMGGRQTRMTLATSKALAPVRIVRTVAKRDAPIPSRLHEGDEAAHEKFVKSLGVNALWSEYLESS